MYAIRSYYDVLLSWDYEIQIPVRTGQDVLDYEGHEGLVFLDYTRKGQSDLGWGSDWRLKVTYSYYQSNQTYSTPYELDISYESGNYVYSDYGVVPIDLAGGQLGFTVRIDKIEGWYDNQGTWTYSSNPQLDNVHFPDDIDVRLELRSQQNYELNVSTPNAEGQRLYFDNTSYRAHWSYVDVITSYSIHYTKLYENMRVFLMLLNSCIPGNNPGCRHTPIVKNRWITKKSLNRQMTCWHLPGV